MSPKEKRWPLDRGREVAAEISDILRPYCHTLLTVGSVRRGAPTVGDVELLFIPILHKSYDLFGSPYEVAKDEASDCIDRLVFSGIIRRRRDRLGRECWGPEIKLAVHNKSGLPLDLFSSTHAAWGSMAICRTGPKGHNIYLARKALQLGMSWIPNVGLVSCTGKLQTPPTEADFYRALQLDYIPPQRR